MFVNGNPTYNLTYDASNNLTKLRMTQTDGTRYDKDFAYDGSNNLTSVTVWKKVV